MTAGLWVGCFSFRLGTAVPSGARPDVGHSGRPPSRIRALAPARVSYRQPATEQIDSHRSLHAGGPVFDSNSTQSLAADSRRAGIVVGLRSTRDGTEYPLLSLIHISEPTRRTPISYAGLCVKDKN